MAFFLNVLIEKRRNGGMAGSKGYRGDREMDEELMAYVSGDLQASTENSWVWAGSETGMNIGSGNSGGGKPGPSPTLMGGGMEDGTIVLTDAEARDWGGWERVEFLVGVLARESGGYVQPVPTRYSGPGAGGGMGPQVRDRSQDRSRGNERMSITSII
jgi:hypothetical protein